MDKKVGEIFEYNGEWYQCIIGNGCENCAFYERKCYTVLDNGLSIGYCSANERKDNKNVFFKKLEKVGEPYIKKVENSSIYQLYKLPMNVETLICQYYWVSLIMSDIVEVAIKQTKEDMEEKKLNLKPFDIQKAREGKPVCTRDGRKTRIICFDRIGAKPILALVSSTDGKGEDVFDYFVSGKSIASPLESGLDLMMLPEKKEGWVNVYKERIYSTKEEAIEATYDGVTYVDTVKVCWEE